MLSLRNSWRVCHSLWNWIQSERWSQRSTQKWENYCQPSLDLQCSNLLRTTKKHLIWIQMSLILYMKVSGIYTPYSLKLRMWAVKRNCRMSGLRRSIWQLLLTRIHLRLSQLKKKTKVAKNQAVGKQRKKSKQNNKKRKTKKRKMWSQLLTQLWELRSQNHYQINRLTMKEIQS